MAIGKDNRLLCHIPADLKRFKQITTGKTVIMGRRTWESLPRKPLPNRRNIVITDLAGERIEGCEMAYSMEDAVNLCRPDEENFIIGGASVYRQFLPMASRLYLTVIQKSFDADAFFPVVDFSQWTLVSREEYRDEGGNDIPYAYETWERIG